MRFSNRNGEQNITILICLTLSKAFQNLMVYIKRTRSFKRYILIDKIFVQFSRLLFQSTNGIPMVTNCTPLLAELCLHAYGANFLQGLLQNKDRKLTKTFISNFRHIDGVLSLNNSRFGDLIYPKWAWIKEYNWSWYSTACFLPGPHLEINNGWW